MFWLGMIVGVVLGMILTVGLCAIGFARGNWGAKG